MLNAMKLLGFFGEFSASPFLFMCRFCFIVKGS